MDKLLPPLVVAVLLLAPMTGIAQPTWDFYGRAHVSINLLDDGQATATGVSSNSSRVGLRLQHDWGNGLRGLAQIEQGLRYFDGSARRIDRDSFIGLQGTPGLLRFGFFNTPLNEVRNRVDLFSDQIGDLRNLTRLRDGRPGGDRDFDTRFYDGVHYRSPPFRAIAIDLHYSTSNTVPATRGNDAISVAATYDANGLYLAGAYEKKNETGSNAFRLGAKYTSGPLSVAGLAQFVGIRDSGLTDNQGVLNYGIGASYEFDDTWTLKGQYHTLSAERSDRDANMAAIGLDYRVAPPFRIMFAYAATRNGDLAAYSMARGGHGAEFSPAAEGENPSGFSLGFRYDF